MRIYLSSFWDQDMVHVWRSKNAVNDFIKTNENFMIDNSINHKQLLTNNPKGYLKKIR